MNLDIRKPSSTALPGTQHITKSSSYELQSWLELYTLHITATQWYDLRLGEMNYIQNRRSIFPVTNINLSIYLCSHDTCKNALVNSLVTLQFNSNIRLPGFFRVGHWVIDISNNIKHLFVTHKKVVVLCSFCRMSLCFSHNH